MKQFIILAITALFLLSAPACKSSKKSQAQSKAPTKGKVVQRK